MNDEGDENNNFTSSCRKKQKCYEVMKRADKLKIDDVFTKSELDRRTCNTNGDFDPVPYFYNIDYAYNCWLLVVIYQVGKMKKYQWK